MSTNHIQRKKSLKIGAYMFCYGKMNHAHTLQSEQREQNTFPGHRGDSHGFPLCYLNRTACVFRGGREALESRSV